MTSLRNDRLNLHRFDKIFQVAAVCLILLLPVAAVITPSSDYSWSALDPNLIYVRTAPESVEITPAALTLLTSAARGESLVNLASASFATEFRFDVRFVSGIQNAARLTVAFSNPYDLRAANLTLDTASDTLWLESSNSTGVVISRQAIAAFSTSYPLKVRVLFVPRERFNFDISQNGRQWNAMVADSALASTVPVNLDLRFRTSGGPGAATLTAALVRLPTDGNRHYTASGLLLNLLYISIVSSTLIGFRSPLVTLLRRARLIMILISHPIRNVPRAYWNLFLISLIALPIQLWVMTLGSHPYERFTQGLWSYLIVQDGPASVYPISLIVPGGRPANLVSPINSAYPYPPLPLYFFSVAGLFGRALDPTFGVFSPGLEYVIKSLWLFLLYATGIVVFREMMRSGACRGCAILAYLFIILNPGLLLESLVMGQFSVMVSFFVVLSVIALRRQKWTAAFLFLILAILSKQTALMLAVIIIPAIFAKAGVLRGLQSAGRSLVPTFFILLPWFLLGISPAFVVDVSVGSVVLNAVASSPVGIAPWQQVVSSFDFNIWPLITALLNGQRGIDRFGFPDNLNGQILGMPYVLFGMVLAVGGLAMVLAELWRSRRAGRLDDELVLLVTVGFLWLFEVLTRLSGRYLAYLLPVTVLLWASSRTVRVGKLLTGLLTLVLSLSLLAMLGITTVIVPGSLSNFRPLAAIISDTFISLLALVQLATLPVLVLVIVRMQTRQPLWGKSYAKPPALPMLSERPKVSVIVLNYNGGSFTRNCVDSILKSTYGNFEVLVVDNASGDDSLDRLRDLLSEGRIKLVQNGENLRYALGNNNGAERASGELLLFLNSDTELDPNTLERMVAQFRINPELGAAQPFLFYLPERDRVYSAGNTLDYLAFHQILGQGSVAIHPNARDQTSYAAGSALMIRRELFEAIGGFEPLLTFYHEDSDLSWRVWLAGYRVGVVPDAVVYHAEGATASSIGKERRVFDLVRSQLIVVAKNYERGHALAGAAALVAVYALAALYFSSRRDRAVARAILGAIGSFFLSMGAIMEARKRVARFRALPDHRIAREFLMPFNPLDVFRRKRTGWGYRADRAGGQLA